MTERILVSLPTYNERENLAPLIAGILAYLPQAEVLVVDDNSPDGTGLAADELARSNPRIHVLHRQGKLGMGSAILAGMRFAIDRRFDHFINMDADFSHHPRYLPALAAGMAHADVMIGSRYVPGGGVANWPFPRWLMSVGTNLIARLLLRLPVRDTSGGFRCYRVSKLRRIRLSAIRSRGYSFQQEMLFRCWQAGCRFGETPIVFADRRAGRSKVNTREIVRSLVRVVAIGVSAMTGQEERAAALQAA